MFSTSEQELKDERARQQVEQGLRQLEQWTEGMLRRLRLTRPVRDVGEAAWRKARRSRRYGLVPRHTETQARVLRYMILLAVATDPSLATRAGELARYYSRNYAWEWLTNAVTGGARDMARDMILRAGDSQWGEAPLAGALSYTLFHHDEVGLEHLSSYSEAYTRALRLDTAGFFRDQAARLRLRLGLVMQTEKREAALKRLEGRERTGPEAAEG
jgi:hypothetical protein